MNGVIDRIEENKIVVELEPEGDRLVLPQTAIPNAREGDAVTEENGVWQVDAEKTKSLRNFVAELRQKLLKRSE